LKDLAAVCESLAGRGVAAAGPAHTISELAAAIYGHKWSYGIDRSGADFRAIIELRGGQLGQLRAIGVAWSMEAALAFALEKAFAIVQRRGAVSNR
jgi:hypothetical protein